MTLAWMETMRTRALSRAALGCMLVLGLMTMLGTSVRGGADAFDGDYTDCPRYLRMAAPTGLAAIRTEAEDEVHVSWHALDLTGGANFTMQLTVILEGPAARRERQVSLGSTGITLDGLSLAADWEVSLALTDRGHVVSDIATVGFTSGLSAPRFGTPFHFRETPGSEPTTTQGNFYYLGFNHNFLNWYVDTGQSTPRTPRLRVGLQHGPGYTLEDAKDIARFSHFQFRLEDAQGNSRLGFDPAMVADTAATYGGRELALGKSDSTDTDPGAAGFSTLRKSNRMARPALEAWHVAAVSHYWSDGTAPLISTVKGASTSQIEGLSFTNLVPAGARKLFAPPPDAIYDMPPDTLYPEGAYTLRAWAVNSDDERISPICTITVHVQERLGHPDGLFTNVPNGTTAQYPDNQTGGAGQVLGLTLLDEDCKSTHPYAWRTGAPPDIYRNRLQALTVAAHTHESTYNRNDWNHWIDADNDCQNTRAEVLITESTGPVTFTQGNQCTVATGQWLGPWGGQTFTAASDVDVDHHVPLKNAHISGGAGWSASRKQAYANDLALAPALQAMEDGLNQSKGAKGPEEWKPSLAGTWCQYARDWIDVKTKWVLTVTRDEQTALGTMLASCTQPPAPTPTPVPAPQVGDVDLVSCDASAEIVTFRNTTAKRLNLTGFSIHDEGPNRTYNFSTGFVMGAGETWTLVSGSGATESLPDKRLLFTTGYVWNNAGDTAYLKQGSVQHDSQACQ